MKEFKIKTYTPELSEAIQKHAFTLGYSWYSDNPKIIMNQGFPLVFRKDYSINWSSDFDADPEPEITLDEFFKLTPEDINPNPLKEKFVELIKSLECASGDSDTYEDVDTVFLFEHSADESREDGLARIIKHFEPLWKE